MEAKNSRRREKGAGTLYKQGPYWVAKWRVGGKTFVRSTRETDYHRAENVLADLTAPFRARSEALRWEGIAARVMGAKAEAERLEGSAATIPVAKIAAAWADSARRRDCAARTLVRYVAQIDALSRFVASRFPEIESMREITDRHAEAYLSSIRSLSPNAYNKRIVLFRRVWKDLSKSAGLVANPWADAEKRRLDTQRHRPLTPDEIGRIVEAATGELRCLVKIGLYTGLRLGDAVLLDWGDVDTEARVLRVKPRKTARTSSVTVEVPLSPPLVQTLAEALGARAQSGFILPETAAKYRRDPSSVSRDVKRLFRSCGITTETRRDGGRARPVASFHSLRHTFVSMCANAGVPLHIVQSIVGHTTMEMTEYYAHANRDVAAREVARAMSSIS